MTYRVSLGILITITTVSVGCGQSQRLPASPSATEGTVSLTADGVDPFAALVGTADPLAVELLGDLHPTQAAEGHGSVEFIKGLTQGYRFSFTARREDEAVPPKKENVEAKGQFEYHPESGNTELRVHGQVICLSVIKNTAVIGGVVTQSDTKEFPVGQEVFFEATDNGEGDSNSLDMLSQVMLAKNARDACLKPPVLKTPPIKDGNIQVPWIK
jgi:hypothetical protein